MIKIVGSSFVKDYYCENCGGYIGTNVGTERHQDVADCIRELRSLVTSANG